MLAHEPERRLEIDWQEAEGERFMVRLALEGTDRRGLYADLAAAVTRDGHRHPEHRAAQHRRPRDRRARWSKSETSRTCRRF